MRLPFDPVGAERSVVRVRQGKRAAAMGFRLGREGWIATACHCLPRVRRQVVLPNPDDPGEPCPVVLSSWDGAVEVRGVVAAADPCGDLAVLSDSSQSGADVGDEERVRFLEFIDALAPTSPSLAPAELRPRRAFVLSHTGEWLFGTAYQAHITLQDPAARIRGGTSGAPVFDAHGSVFALVSTSNEHGPDGRMALLADCLPGWALQALGAFRPRTSRATRPSGSRGARRSR